MVETAKLDESIKATDGELLINRVVVQRQKWKYGEGEQKIFVRAAARTRLYETIETDNGINKKGDLQHRPPMCFGNLNTLGLSKTPSHILFPNHPTERIPFQTS